MRISDWSSDVCSSDLHLRGRTVAILRRLGRTHSRRLPAPRRPARRIAGASRGRPLRRRRAAVPPLVPARRPRSGLISNERISTMTDTKELTITRYIDAPPETLRSEDNPGGKECVTSFRLQLVLDHLQKKNIYST